MTLSKRLASAEELSACQQGYIEMNTQSIADIEEATAEVKNETDEHLCVLDKKTEILCEKARLINKKQNIIIAVGSIFVILYTILYAVSV